MLKKGHLENCLNQYLKPYPPLPREMYLGYMEACLVQFGVIESKDNGLADYAKNTRKRFLFWEWTEHEGREKIIVRLVKEYLNKREL